MTRSCTKCGTVKALSEFYARARKPGRTPSLDGRCKVCIRAQMARYREANYEKVRAGQLAWREQNRDELSERQYVRKYGITWADRNEILAAQGGRCAICRTTDPRGRGWHTDHDHGCCPGKANSCGSCIRGILCGDCNLMLGNASDNTATLLAAVDYLNNVSRMTPI